MRHDLNRWNCLQEFEEDWEEAPQNVSGEDIAETFFHA